MDNTQPAVSIIVPCYNYAAYLGDTLRSLQLCSLINWECLVIDDGSTDSTASVAMQFAETDPRIKYHYQENAGLSAARNAGIAKSSGKYLQLLDADDKLSADKLSLQAAYLDEHPDVSIVYSRAMFFHTDYPGVILQQRTDHPASHHTLQRSAGAAQMLALLCRNNIMEVACALYRRSLAEKSGGFDAAFTSFEDWHYWIRCALAGASFAFLPLQGTEALIRFGHMSMMSNLERMNENGLRLRMYLHTVLPPGLQAYNLYRILRLTAKKYWLRVRA